MWVALATVAWPAASWRPSTDCGWRDPELGPKPLLAKLREQQPDLKAGNNSQWGGYPPTGPGISPRRPGIPPPKAGDIPAGRGCPQAAGDTVGPSGDKALKGERSRPPAGMFPAGRGYIPGFSRDITADWQP